MSETPRCPDCAPPEASGVRNDFWPSAGPVLSLEERNSNNSGCDLMRCPRCGHLHVVSLEERRIYIFCAGA